MLINNIILKQWPTNKLISWMYFCDPLLIEFGIFAYNVENTIETILYGFENYIKIYEL